MPSRAAMATLSTKKKEKKKKKKMAAISGLIRGAN